jgi:hypothetical protein
MLPVSFVLRADCALSRNKERLLSSESTRLMMASVANCASRRNSGSRCSYQEVRHAEFHRMPLEGFLDRGDRFAVDVDRIIIAPML